MEKQGTSPGKTEDERSIQGGGGTAPHRSTGEEFSKL
ncbi:hypothetical protein PC116_g3335 [Phytophthora cactorum]|nr:hypothetical protein PC116_g3335 [Phytophthora cactorum]